MRCLIAGASRGFSLFEVLVVLVIVGLVSSLSVTMVSQLRRNLERFYPAAERYGRLQIRTSMLARTIAGLVPSRTPEAAFSGGPLQLLGLTTYYPADDWPAERLTRIIVMQGSDAQTVVKAERIDARGGVEDTFELLRLPCNTARLFYLDFELRWVDQWKQQREYPHVPLAVRFSCDTDDRPLHVIAAIEREGVSTMTDVHMLQMPR